MKGLLTVARKNGNWVITSIDVKGSALEKDYASLQERLHAQRYLTRTTYGFAMKALEARPDEMSFVDKQMLIHMLRKAENWLGGPAGGEAKTQGGLPFQGLLKFK